MYEDAERSLHAQLQSNEFFGFASPPVYAYATYGTWEFGGRLPFPSSELHETPTPPYYPLRSKEGVFELERPDVRKAGMLPTAMRFSELQHERDLPISVQVGGVFTIAGGICGLENLCLWMLESPEVVHAMLREATEHLVEVIQLWVDTFGARCVTPHIWESLATQPIVSPAQFHDLVLPHARELNERVLTLGVPHILCHICGDQNRNLPYWAEIPMGDPGIVSVGSEADLEEVSSYFPRHVIMGNLSPALLKKGTSDQVYEAAKTCIEKGKRHPGGFILAPGCELPPETPPSNVQAMMRAASDFGSLSPAH
jgi:uroporphyrinogen decarboxylase